MNLKKLIIKIFIGTYDSNYQLIPAIRKQKKNIKKVWNNTHYKDFGIERIIRLFLVLIQFVFPALYIRDITGRMGLLGRKLGVEIYVMIKLFLPIIFFAFHLTNNLFVFIFSIYLLLETIIYLLSLILLSDIYSRPITYKRSLLLLFINFMEIGLEYAVIFSYLNNHINKFFSNNLNSAVDIIYFSFVSLSTLGFGDITVNNEIGKLVVLAQIFTFILFIGLFLNFYASKIQENTYFNSKKPKLKNKRNT